MLRRYSPFFQKHRQALSDPKTTSSLKPDNRRPLSVALAVKTLYLAKDKYFSCETGTITQEHRGPAVLEIGGYTRIQAQPGTRQAGVHAELETEH